MRSLYSALFLATGLIFAAPVTQASSFDYVQLNYTKVDALGVNADGPQVEFSKSFYENYFMSASYGDYSSDASGIDANVTYLRAGVKSNPSQGITTYAGVEGVRLDFDLINSSVDESGYGVFGGVRNMLTDALEFNTEFKASRLLDDNQFSAELGLRYYFNPQFSVHVTGTFADLEGYRIGAAYHF